MFLKEVGIETRLCGFLNYTNGINVDEKSKVAKKKLRPKKG